MRRPGCTASLAVPRAGPSRVAVASRSATVKASPKNPAGPSPAPSAAGSSGPMSSMITSPALKKVWRIGAP